MTPILIVGGTGLIGAEVVRILVAQGHPVRALVRDRARAENLDTPGVEIVVADLSDPSSLESTFSDVRAALLVTNLAPEQIALQGNFVAAAAATTSPHVVKVSGFLTAPDSPARSGRWHAETEAAIRAHGLPWTFLRPPFFMQNLFHTRPHALESGEIAMPIPTGKIAMVDARDVAAVAAVALLNRNHVGQAYTVTGPEALSLKALANRLSAHRGSPVSFRPTLPADTRAALEAAGAPEWRIQLVLEFYEGFEAGRGAEVNDVVKRLTGRSPRNLEDFLKSANHGEGQAAN